MEPKTEQGPNIGILGVHCTADPGALQALLLVLHETNHLQMLVEKHFRPPEQKGLRCLAKQLEGHIHNEHVAEGLGMHWIGLVKQSGLCRWMGMQGAVPKVRPLLFQSMELHLCSVEALFNRVEWES